VGFNLKQTAASERLVVLWAAADGEAAVARGVAGLVINCYSDCCCASKEDVCNWWATKVDVAWLWEMESLLSEGGQTVFGVAQVFRSGVRFFT
jgi:hypothetical protein